jgi:DNA-binding MarR family transcriptional regulator
MARNLVHRAKRAVPDSMEVNGASWRHDNIGRLLNSAIRRFEARVIELMAEAGHVSTRISHISLTRNLDLTGTRVTELAQRSAMTKQAVGELVDQCAELGLIERRPDPADGRARIVTFTKTGLEWLADCRSAVMQAELEMRELIGARRLDDVKTALRRYGASYDRLGRGET